MIYGLYGCLGMEKTIRKVGQHKNALPLNLTVRKVGQHKNALLLNLSGILPEDWRYRHVIITVLERGDDEVTIKLKRV